MGAHDVESSKYSKLKKAFVVENGKYGKLPKAYVVEGGKYVKLWSAMGRFLYQTTVKRETDTSSGYYDYSIISDDGLTWTTTEVERPYGFADIIYAKGKYWGAYFNYQTCKVYSSEDAINWTLTATIKESTTPSSYMGYGGIIRYENGVFIIHGEYSGPNYKALYVSTDGVTWTGTTYDPMFQTWDQYGSWSSFTISGNIIDIRYGVVNDVPGWYMLASDKERHTMVYVFKTLDDLKTGNIQKLFHTSTMRANRGILDIRGGTLYILSAYYTGEIRNTSHTVFLHSYTTSLTQISKESGHSLGSIWITDKTISYRGIWENEAQMSWSIHYAKYNFDSKEFWTGTGDWYGETTKTKNTAFVDGRMWQITEDRGAYSDNYGATVTRFVPFPNEVTGTTYEMLVYGDEDYGYYRE